MPVTRGRAKAALSASATPTTVVSPTFSAAASVCSTPGTSVMGEEDTILKQAIAETTKTTRNSKKRVLEDAFEQEVQASSSKRGAKRRVIRNQKTAFVEIGSPKQTKSSASEVPPRVTRRSTRVTVPTISEEPDDCEESAVVSESDFDPSESDAGSDFVGESDEEALVETAVRQSLVTARTERDKAQGLVSGGAGPSKSRAKATSKSTSKAGRPRGRRPLKEEESTEIEDNSSSDIEFDDSFIIESDDSDEEPVVQGEEQVEEKNDEGNGKGKEAEHLKPLTKQQLKKMSHEERKMYRLRQRGIAKEEAMMRVKLGRKLTPAEKATIALQRHHPELHDVWGDLQREIQVIAPKKAEQPPNLKVQLLPFQLESLAWFKEQEKSVWSGGMLADEMGMGKTIQMISLLVSDYGARPNLVVAPTVAIMQWRNEIALHTDNMLKTLVWHGSSRETNIKTLKKYDVVLTSYAVLESCFRKEHSGFKRKGKIIKERSPLHAIEWKRIILDEAHNIKERATNTAKAAFELQAKYRWCLSGTPLQNRVGELYSLVRFLGGDPFSYYFCKSCDCKSLHWKFTDKRSCDDCGHSPMKHTCFWNNEILTPIQKHAMAGPGAIAFKKLKILLDRMLLRRTKVERADDLGLPPRTVIIKRDYFSPEEKELYQSLFSDAKRQFNTYVDSGTVLNNYSNIFSLLTRMRQMACHPDLVLRSKNNIGVFNQEEAGEGTVCRLCNEFAEDAIQSKCRHVFDRECVKQYLEACAEPNPACPVCHVALTIDLEAPAIDVDESAAKRQGILGRLDLNKWRSSSKIEALVEELSNLRKQDATTKSIVFSQFVNFLDLIAFRLQKAGFIVCRLEGTMSPQARDATIKYFMNNVHVTVFLVSLKAGGVALNLTEASRVYLMDSWWNPAVEYQAMDRIHRLGQRRPVQAIKLVIEDSIESRIVQLQEKKAAMVDATLSTDDSAMGRLTPADLGFLFRL